MIAWISNWAEAIIIAVIIATIIEMILPEGSSKKYIKVVIGVYILFTIISPVVSKVTGKAIAVSDMLDLDQYIDEVKEKETSQNLLQEKNETSIRNIYIGNLKADIQNKLKGKGYSVKEISLDVGYDDNYTLNGLELVVDKDKEEEQEEGEESSNNINTNIEVVNEISVTIANSAANMNSKVADSKKSNLSNSDKKKLKEYLSSTYEVNEKNITIH